jgi:hypothetical protein
MKYLSGQWCPGRHSNQVPPEYKLCRYIILLSANILIRDFDILKLLLLYSTDGDDDDDDNAEVTY